MESGEKDLLSKQAILNLPRDKEFNLEGKLLAEYVNVKDIEALPTIQPEERTEKRMETHACDLISRKAAIDEINHICPVDTEYDCTLLDRVDVICVLSDLPPAQPSQDKYEYHYDHTDCIWYRPEARNRCPATCAQYRDGWNDAMNYIFRDGEGYRPFRRDKKYDG